VLTHIFNHIFVSSEFPGKWKTSVALPIPKVSSPAKFSDDRPVSFLVCLSKVFEVLMARQMERHIFVATTCGLFFNLDFVGSTAAVVLKVTEDIRLSMEDGRVTVLLLLLEFSQAFTWAVAVQAAKCPELFGWCWYASGVIFQFVRSSGQESSVGAVTCGVPQGSVLGPLLFISYIDDVSRVIRYYRFHIYADDLQIYHTCALSDFQKCIDELNCEWS
jgi:hypothetical protein